MNGGGNPTTKLDTEQHGAASPFEDFCGAEFGRIVFAYHVRPAIEDTIWALNTPVGTATDSMDNLSTITKLCLKVLDALAGLRGLSTADQLAPLLGCGLLASLGAVISQCLHRHAKFQSSYLNGSGRPVASYVCARFSASRASW